MQAEKKLTSIRLNRALYSDLQKEAKKQNRSLNNYIETILMDSVYREPNDETLEAMSEIDEMIKNGTGKGYKDVDELIKALLDE